MILIVLITILKKVRILLRDFFVYGFRQGNPDVRTQVTASEY